MITTSTRERERQTDRQTDRISRNNYTRKQTEKRVWYGTVRHTQKHDALWHTFSSNFRVTREFQLYTLQHITIDLLKVTRKRCLGTDLLRTRRCRIVGDSTEVRDHGMRVLLFIWMPVVTCQNTNHPNMARSGVNRWLRESLVNYEMSSYWS